MLHEEAMQVEDARVHGKSGRTIYNDLKYLPAFVNGSQELLDIYEFGVPATCGKLGSCSMALNHSSTPVHETRILGVL
jgi:hypothetical protein